MKKELGPGAEFADVVIEDRRLAASGIAIGSAPIAYRLDYQLETYEDFITSGLLVTTKGEGWSRHLDLRRSPSGGWTIRTEMDGFLALPEPGGDVAEISEALDCDLGLSPLTNSMPVLRHGLQNGGGPLDFLMAWVSVPDLAVYAIGQQYRFMRNRGKVAIVRYRSLGSNFTADLSFDSDGLVIEYPGIGHRIGD
ncbi:MAG TPA: putative glycolipid-binding domain-containing protein [Methylomirabilota bacterium]|nr:putative glycolipid-binding domain-containing protein [Methylomirabilota bacterium]